MTFSARRPRAWLGLLLAVCFGAPASAAVRLEISGAPGDLRDNIRAHVGVLPETPDADGRRLQRRIRGAAEQAAQALGYYNSRIELDRARRDDDVVFRLAVRPGQRTRITSIELDIQGDAADDQVFARARRRLPIAVGQPLDHGSYEDAKRILQNLALRRGYFDARFTRQRVVVDAAANAARVELTFVSGQRYRIGEVRFPETPFDDRLLAKMVPFEQGAAYQAEAIVDLNRILLESQYFQSVRVRPLPDRAVDRRVPVEVALEAAEPNRVGLGLGYSTDVGPRARINWRRRWVNRRGHSAGAQLELSEVRQTVQSQYQIPLSSPIDDILEFQLGLQDEELQDTASERFTLSAQRQQRLQSGWRRTVSIRYDYTDFTVGDEQDITELVLPGVSFTRTRTRGGADPTWGDRLLLSTEATHPALGSDIELQRVRVGGRWLRSLAREHRFLLRADLGALASSDFDRVPPSLRFFAGGDQSVRGFAYNSISPINSDGDTVGGRYLYTGSAEYGWYFRDTWRLALFADAGNAADAFSEDLKVGAGFGIHWISPVGPIRLDFGWGVSEERVPFRLHFSMGPQL
jgi:translocation and assembly module TamA